MDKEDVVCVCVCVYIYMYIYIHNGILFFHEKEGNGIIFNNLGGPWRHYAK